MFVAHLLKYGTKRRYHVWVQAVIIQVTETEGLHSRQLLALLFSFLSHDPANVFPLFLQLLTSLGMDIEAQGFMGWIKPVVHFLE
eukprot:scaffold195090_cov16-Tisochrysis_lutea.AAC.2